MFFCSLKKFWSHYGHFKLRDANYRDHWKHGKNLHLVVAKEYTNKNRSTCLGYKMLE